MRDTSSSSTAYWNASALFWGAVAAFVFFHFLPVAKGNNQGWTVWGGVVRRLQNPGMIRHSQELLFIASLPTFVALVAASPFLVRVYLKSRLAWGLAAFTSAYCTFAIWNIVPLMVKYRGIDVGGWCLLAAPALNFAGLLVLRLGGPTRDHPERNRDSGERQG